MLLLLSVALACLCAKLNLSSSVCVGNTLVDSTIYEDCSYAQAALDCGLVSCIDLVRIQGTCNFVCECAPGCTMDMLSGGGTTYCNPACDNAACNHCLPDGSGTSLYSNCPTISQDISQCLNEIPTLETCESWQSYLDCYLPYECLSDKLTAVCEGLGNIYPNCTFDCTSGASFLHAVLALLLAV